MGLPQKWNLSIVVKLNLPVHLGHQSYRGLLCKRQKLLAQITGNDAPVNMYTPGALPWGSVGPMWPNHPLCTGQEERLEDQSVLSTGDIHRCITCFMHIYKWVILFLWNPKKKKETFSSCVCIMLKHLSHVLIMTSIRF